MGRGGDMSPSPYRRPILARVKSAAHWVCRHKTLDVLEHGHLKRAQWHAWARDRHFAGGLFTPLLETAIARVKLQGLEMLAQVLQANLNDERGIVNGSAQEAKSHAVWRGWFYSSLGLTDADLLSVQENSNGLELCIATSEYLASLGSPFEIAGALLFLELFIPMEFRRVRQGLYLAFPDAFILEREDNEPTREQKRRARLYLDDHIEHDTHDHFPQLLDAIAASVASKDDLLEVYAGIREMSEARREFYEDLLRSFRVSRRMAA